MRRTLNSVTSRCWELINRRYHSTSVIEDLVIRGVRPFEEIPGPGGIYNTPIIGPAFHFKPFSSHTIEKVHHLFNELVDTHGSLVRINLGKWCVLVEDAADIETVMKNEGKCPRRDGHLIHELYCENSGLRKGLILLQGKEWQNFRSPVNAQMMRARSAQHFLSAQNEVADDLVTRMKQDQFTPHGMSEMFFKYSCESICVVAFNKRLGYLQRDVDMYPDKLQSLKDVRDMFRIMNECLYIHPFVLKNFPLKVKDDYKAAVDRLVSQAHDHYHGMLEDIRQRQSAGTLDSQEKNLMLSLLMSNKLTVDDMGAIALDLFSGGTDSTARMIQMLLYVLARNPDKQEKLFQEVLGELGPCGTITVAALENMKYLPACLKESFRLYHPVLTGTQRYLPTDITLQGYRIPAGTSLIMMNQKTVKNRKYFPDPEAFLPERWLRDTSGKRMAPIPPSALLPFGFGPRQCVGKRFAEQEIYLAVSKIIQNFEVSLEPGHEEIDVLYEIFIGTKEPIRFVFKERK
ncbi:probable cytochrome P450 CYP44 [Haliotis rubra]|uniref:probable cytochrome P450 CYP44 n=1 Tax=Haliotis rubra TaxID=36100 RepID=UPI001EE60B17|nr:probable cytochrome P450 CYP44 [Haliotis rubra]